MNSNEICRQNLELTENLAREAGAYLLKTYQSGNIRVDNREPHDVKLEADRGSENIIIQRLREERPKDGIISEECGANETTKEGVWIIDPLDGTVNFSHGHPHFCVSIGWCRNGEVEIGAVFDPVRDELFSATRNGGAFCNGMRISTASTPKLDQAMLAVGYGKLPGQESLRQMEKLADRVQKMRISGSAALDLAYLACGRLDGYCENRIYVWDLAAGLLIARQAGAIGYMWPDDELWRRSCLAATPALAEEITIGLQLNKSTATAGWTE